MRRAIAAAAAICLAATFPAAALAEYRGTDVWSQINPDSAGHFADKYPLSYYGLDYHVEGPHGGLGGISLGDIPGLVAQVFAFLLWLGTTWAINIVISIFDWAFSLDLLNGPHGALMPIGQATQNLYTNTLAPFLAVAVVLAGMWMGYKILKREHAQAVSGVLISLVCVVAALVLIFKPAQTIGTASQMTNQVSDAILAGGTTGSTDNGSQARTAALNHLNQTFKYNPWVVLEFGGLKHCVFPQVDKDGFPKPNATSDTPGATCRDHLKAHNGWGGYAPRFLESPPGSDERDAMYEAMKDGKSNPEWPTWRIDKADAPAVDLQQGGMGAFQRLGLAAFIAIGVVGVCLLLGAIAFAALLAQAALLVALAFAPAALIIGVFPGVGHTFFRAWGKYLLIFLFIKVVFSLLITILVAVSLALQSAIGDISFYLAFGLQAGFFWLFFLKRKQVGAMFIHERHVTEIEHTTRTAISAPIATVTGMAAAGWAAARGRGGEDHDDAETGEQEHVGRPASTPVPQRDEPAAQPPSEKPVPSPTRETVTMEHEPIGKAEPVAGGRESLADTLGSRRDPEQEDVPDPPDSPPIHQRTVGEALYAARQAEHGNGRENGQEGIPRPADFEHMPHEEPAPLREPVRHDDTRGDAR